MRWHQFETLMFLTRSEEELPTGQLNYAHYKAIHHHFFQDVYNWAGCPRESRTAKNGNWFCYPEYIDTQMEKIFEQLAAEHHLSNVESIVKFAERASYYVAEINGINPFREGNGRCQLTLLSILFDVAGFVMNEDLLDPAEIMEAMIISFRGDNAPLARTIRAMSGPIRET